MSLGRLRKAVDDIDDVFDAKLFVKMLNENGWPEEKHFGHTQFSVIFDVIIVDGIIA